MSSLKSESRNGAALEGVLAQVDCPDEVLLLRVARERDQDAFGALVGRHANAALGLAGRMCGSRERAEEALQEAFLRVWQGAASYEAGRDPRAWIMKIVVREALKQERTAVRRKRRDRRSVAQAGRAAGDPGQVSECQELRAGLGQALLRLAPAEQELVALYYGAGFSQEQIARHLAVPQRLVSYRLQSALGQLRKCLGKLGLFAGAGIDFEAQVAAALRDGPPALPLGTAFREHLRERIAREPATKRWGGRMGGLQACLMALAVAALGSALVLVPVFRAGPSAGPAALLRNEGRSSDSPGQEASGAFDERLPAGYEVVYQDEFERNRLDAFWELGRESRDLRFERLTLTRVATAAPGLSPGSFRASVLTLQAGRTSAVRAESVQETAICGSLIDLRASRAGRLELISLSPEVQGRAEYGVRIEDQSGQVVFQRGWLVEQDSSGRGYQVTEVCRTERGPIPSDFGSQKRPILFGIRLTLDLSCAGGPPAAGLPLVSGRTEYDEPEASAPRATGRVSIRVSSGFRLCCYVRAAPGASIAWPLDRCRLSRTTGGAG